MEHLDFKATRIIGDYQRIYIDEIINKFYVSFSDSTITSSPLEKEIYCFTDVNEVYIDIQKKSQEIKIRNWLKKAYSFNPPCYAISFDFVVRIGLINQPIDAITIKLNCEPVCTDQPLLITLSGSEGTKAEIISQSSYYGYRNKTSNEDEVRICKAFQKYIRFSKLIYKCFPNCTSSEPDVNYCQWCGSEMEREPFCCPHCSALNRPAG